MIRIFRALVPISALALLFGDAVLATFGYLTAAFFDQDVDIGIFLTFELGWFKIAQILAVLLIGFYLQDFYSWGKTRTRTAILQNICFAIGPAFLLQALLSTIDLDWMLPRKIMMTGSVLAILLIFGWHVLFQAALGNLPARQRVVFLGASPGVFELARHLTTHPGLGLLPAGYLDEAPAPQADGLMPWLGPAHRYAEIFDAQEPAWIIIGQLGELRPGWVDDFLELRFGGVQIETIDTLFEESFGRVYIKQLRPGDLTSWTPVEPDTAARIQATVSSGAAILLTVLASPFMLLIALLARLSAGSPVLTRTRVAGLHGKPFTLYRFRCTDDAGGRRKLTALGKWLRRTRLECLPQLFNVIAGSMAFVGPRPQRVAWVNRLGELLPFYSLRHITRPGLIGWAQVKSEAAENTLRSLEYDLYYAKSAARNTLISLDFLVLTQTLKQPWLYLTKDSPDAVSPS